MGEKVSKISALVVFTDIRGFTKWSENIEIFQYSPEFIASFYTSLEEQFEGWNSKKLGDGSLFIKTLKENEHEKVIISVISKILKVNKSFEKLCKTFAEKRGQETPLTLGWGIARGSVNEICYDDGHKEYIGAVVNKTSRLCDIARPNGIVIDAQNFSNLGKHSKLFFKQKRKIKSIEKDIDVWVTEKIANAFQKREDIREMPEVHVAGFCIMQESEALKILIAKREKNRSLYPSLFEGCGGQLKYSEGFTEGVIRHFRTEMNITVKVLENIHKFYSIKEPNEPYIPGIIFLCKHIEGKPFSNNHEEIKWVNEEELKSMEESLFIPNVKNEILELLEIYKNHSVNF